MAQVKFNKTYKDLEKDKIIEAGEEVEMTLKRADEVVNKLKDEEGYEGFEYERLDSPKKSDD